MIDPFGLQATSGTGTPQDMPIYPSAPGGPSSTATSAGAVAGALDKATKAFSDAVMWRLIEKYNQKGYIDCLAQAKKKGDCDGCCRISLYKLIGKYDGTAALVYGNAVFYRDKTCLELKDIFSKLNFSETITPYYGRIDSSWHYDINQYFHPESVRSMHLDDQSPVSLYRDINSWEITGIPEVRAQ